MRQERPVQPSAADGIASQRPDQTSDLYCCILAHATACVERSVVDPAPIHEQFLAKIAEQKAELQKPRPEDLRKQQMAKMATNVFLQVAGDRHAMHSC